MRACWLCRNHHKGGGRRVQQIKRELAKAGISYVDECLGGNIQGVRIGDMYIVEHGSGTGYYFGDLEDAGEACYTLEEVLELAKKYWGETEIEGIGVVVIAIVEVGEDYIDQLITIKTDRCSLEEAKKEARDAGYRVIDEYCQVVPTTHEVHIIVAVEPE